MYLVRFHYHSGQSENRNTYVSCAVICKPHSIFV